MRYVSLIAIFAFAFVSALFAQQHSPTEPLDEIYSGHEEAVRSVMQYCDTLDDALEQREPRIFGSESGHKWREFFSRGEWEEAGRPAPLAFVWDREGSTVRVTVMARISVGMRRRVEYCYGADTKLLRIRAVPFVPTNCEFLFPCRLIRGEPLLSGQRTGTTDWVLARDGTVSKLRNGKAEDDYFDPSNSLTVNDLHVTTSADLPFKPIPPK